MWSRSAATVGRGPPAGGLSTINLQVCPATVGDSRPRMAESSELRRSRLNGCLICRESAKARAGERRGLRKRLNWVFYMRACGPRSLGVTSIGKLWPVGVVALVVAAGIPGAAVAKRERSVAAPAESAAPAVAPSPAPAQPGPARASASAPGRSAGAPGKRGGGDGKPGRGLGRGRHLGRPDPGDEVPVEPPGDGDGVPVDSTPSPPASAADTQTSAPAPSPPAPVAPVA